MADACAIECHERILRGREVGEGGLRAAVVEMRGDGKVPGIGETLEDALDVFVHAPTLLGRTTTACFGSPGESGRLTVSGTSCVVVVKVPISRL